MRKVELINTNFLQCTCGFYARMGLPCKHVLRITNVLSETMCHIRWAKQYLFQFGKTEQVTNLLLQMQQHGQNNLVPITSSVQLPKADVYPSFLFDTSDDDGNAMLLLHRQSEPVTLHRSLSELSTSMVLSSQEESMLSHSTISIQEETVFSPRRRQIQHSLPSVVDDEGDYELSFDGTMKICKNLFNIVRDQPNGVAMLQQKLYNLYADIVQEISSRRPNPLQSDVVSTAIVRGRKKCHRIKSAGL